MGRSPLRVCVAVPVPPILPPEQSKPVVVSSGHAISKPRPFMSNVKILFARLALLAVCGFVVGGAFTADPVIGYVVFGIMLVAVRLATSQGCDA